jgi:DNA-binding response OmpR family regulator
VLVVDDDADMRAVMVLVLGHAGYAVRDAENGALALEAVSRRLPGLILLDTAMPVMDGWQFARALRSKFGHSVPIVVVTGSENARVRALELGAAEVLAKPFDVARLLAVVARFVAKQAKRPPSEA